MTNSRTRWCPKCEARFPRDTFSTHADDVYVGDGRRMGRAYEHEPCGAVVVALLPVVQSAQTQDAPASSG